MTAQAVKRKRYEGFSQFTDPLRSALVCLQAALTGRFATGAQLEFLKQRDTTENSHFILSHKQTDLASDLAALEPEHLLLRITQGELLTKPLMPCGDSKISAWLDSDDLFATQYLFQLLTQAATPHAGEYCLKKSLTWGSVQLGWDSLLNSAPAWVSKTRLSLFKAFHKDAAPLFQKLESVNVLTDGCLVALVLEGVAREDWERTSKKALKSLPKGERHLIAVNGRSDASRTLQVAYLAPLKLLEKDLQSSALKGVLLLRDIKQAAKDSPNMLAS